MTASTTPTAVAIPPEARGPAPASVRDEVGKFREWL